MSVDKTYWGGDFPHPLAPNDNDVLTYKSNMRYGTTLLLGCTKKLISISDRQLDIDPWYVANTVIKGDWIDNKHFYTNIIIDGGLCFTKELTDKILTMASENCDYFIARVFNRKLDIMRIADYFPSFKDFAIKPKKYIREDDYTFYIWDFKNK